MVTIRQRICFPKTKIPVSEYVSEEIWWVSVRCREEVCYIRTVTREEGPKVGAVSDLVMKEVQEQCHPQCLVTKKQVMVEAPEEGNMNSIRSHCSSNRPEKERSGYPVSAFEAIYDLH